MHSIESLQRSIPIHLRKAAKWADKNDYVSALDHVNTAIKQMTEITLMEMKSAVKLNTNGACEVE
jgi:hypothetical protein